MIEYSVRESPRARRVRLVMTVREGLVVVVPNGYDRRGIPAILRDKGAWIARAAAEMERRRALAVSDQDDTLPERVSLACIREEWRVEYRPGPMGTSGARAREIAAGGENVVRVTGDVANEHVCRAALSRWLMRKGHEHLVPALEVMADELGFRVGPISIRRQRSRWGSCSRRASISLNAKLLFLPPDLMEYVLLHELCHTVEPNHSARFWSLLESHDPGYRGKRRRLRDGEAFVPWWIAAPRGEEGVE